MQDSKATRTSSAHEMEKQETIRIPQPEASAQQNTHSEAPLSPPSPPGHSDPAWVMPYTSCQRAQKILSRLLCVGVALSQGVTLDAFLVEAFGDDRLFFLFLIVDIFVAVVIAVTMVINYSVITAIRGGRVTVEGDRRTFSLGKAKLGSTQ